MEKNIAAFLRSDTKTVGVRFFKSKFQKEEDVATMTILGADMNTTYDLSDKQYCYITNLDLEVGDIVIVPVLSICIPTAAVVTTVDEDLNIDPNCNTEFRYVMGKLDKTYYEDLIQKNKEITDIVRESYKARVRTGFREMLLGSVDSKTKKALLSLTK